jgi:NAD(P)-dependent dehydrogenase (short-subunit alcohol dehydrogenase family)
VTGLLTGQAAVVLGAASGIGRAVTTRIVDEGASVVAFDIAADPLGRLACRQGSAVVPVVGDATDAEDVDRAVGVAVERFGGVDVLVCCAGRFDFRTPVTGLDAGRLSAAFDEIFAVNVKSALLAVRAAARSLRERGGSVVLTVSSSAVHPDGAGVLYGASKWAVRGLVVHLARELAPHVRVNGVAPGGTGRTRLGGLEALGQRDRVGDGPDRDRLIAQSTLLRRSAVPEDHAGAYLFLASRQLSPMVTGTVVSSDGGRGEPLDEPADDGAAGFPSVPTVTTPRE